MNTKSNAMTTLTQHTRFIVAETIRRYVARDIEARGIVETYDPAIVSVSAFELIEFADELLHCHAGDNIDLVEGVTDLAAESDVDDRAQDIADEAPPLPALAKLEESDALEIEERRRGL